ncbi:hypothetical protein D3C71_1163290 [compost metagenome]
MLRASASMMYENAQIAAVGGAGDDDGEDGVTQKLSLTASVSFTRKIYSRL